MTEKKKPFVKWIVISVSLVLLFIIYILIQFALWLNALATGAGDAASGFAEFIFPLRKD